jgi:hypothetical protein
VKGCHIQGLLVGSVRVTYMNWCRKCMCHVYQISSCRVYINDDKICAVLSWSLPVMVCVVRVFLSLVGYYWSFIKDYDTITEPLTRLICKDGFHWSPEVEEAFCALQRALTSAPILNLSTFDKEFVVECDTSDIDIGAVLHHGDGPVGFFSYQIASWQSNLVAYEHMLIGLV